MSNMLLVENSSHESLDDLQLDSLVRGVTSMGLTDTGDGLLNERNSRRGNNPGLFVVGQGSRVFEERVCEHLANGVQSHNLHLRVIALAHQTHGLEDGLC